MLSKLYTSIAILSAEPLLDVCASPVHIRALAAAAVPMPAKHSHRQPVIPESRREKFYAVLAGAFTGEGIGVARTGPTSARTWWARR